MRSLAGALLAEAIGVFCLVFCGCGAIMVDAKSGGPGEVGIALAFGLAIMVMIYAVGHVSGAHLNPAVSLAFGLSRHFPLRRVGFYWVAQCAGAIAAAAVLRGSLGDVANVGATTPSGSDAQSFLWEVVLTFFLMFVIMAVATDTRAVGEAAAIAIGGTVALGALVGGPVSGASMNPARSLGPALVSGTFDALWVYLVAPAAGRRARCSRVPCGAIVNVYFVCIGNAGRSQMAEAFAKQAGLEARSAGSRPAAELDPVVVEAMRELGIDLTGRTPRGITQEDVEWADVVVTMGCGRTRARCFPASGTSTGSCAIRSGCRSRTCA